MTQIAITFQDYTLDEIWAAPLPVVKIAVSFMSVRKETRLDQNEPECEVPPLRTSKYLWDKLPYISVVAVAS
jgi:hypothetical protein